VELSDVFPIPPAFSTADKKSSSKDVESTEVTTW
jgi:hypothetical protein